jgi:hypothetical protein
MLEEFGQEIAPAVVTVVRLLTPEEQQHQHMSAQQQQRQGWEQQHGCVGGTTSADGTVDPHRVGADSRANAADPPTTAPSSTTTPSPTTPSPPTAIHLPPTFSPPSSYSGSKSSTLSKGLGLGFGLGSQPSTPSKLLVLLDMNGTVLLREKTRYGARFPKETYTRGCHWFPHLLA